LKDDTNTLNGSIHTIKKNRAFSIVASTEIGLEATAEETKHTTMSQDQHAGQIQNINDRQ
jgi:hypothetical protein